METKAQAGQVLIELVIGLLLVLAFFFFTVSAGEVLIRDQEARRFVRSGALK